MDHEGASGQFVALQISLLLALVRHSSGYAALTGCKNESSSATSLQTTDWLENEVVSGFRVWQILFLVIGGVIVIVVALCCCMRCRIPRTRQEIEANYKRTQITNMFRSFLDRAPVEEIDLLWALETVKCLQEKENINKKERKIMKVMKNDDSVFPDEDKVSIDDGEEEEEKPKSFLDTIFRILRRTKICHNHSSSLEECEKLSDV